jgi:hypothetical protein
MTFEGFAGHYIPTAGSACFLAGIIIGAFKWANQTIASDLRDSVALWILGETSNGGWPLAASQVFEALYGPSYFSRRIFIVNLCFSAIATGMAFFLLLTGPASSDEASYYIIALIMINFFYLFPVLLVSYIKARWLARNLAKAKNPLWAMAILAIDLFLTALIWAALIGLILLPAQTGIDSPLMNLLALPFVVFSFSPEHYQDQYIPIFIASWLPSILVAFVVAAIVAQRFYLGAAPLLGRASRVLSRERIEKEPLSLIGEVIAALVFIFVCAYGLS